VVIDRASGRITYAVVSFGGFLGMGEKLFAVPWGAFSQPKADQDKFVLDIDKERLKNAPGFDEHNWPQMASQEWVTSLYSYYHVPPYWTAATEGSMATATVKNVDPNQRTITLQVDGRMLQNLQAGDSTQVTIRKNANAK
jgi:PRC-barrel domain